MLYINLRRNTGKLITKKVIVLTLRSFSLDMKLFNILAPVLASLAESVVSVSVCDLAPQLV